MKKLKCDGLYLELRLEINNMDAPRCIDCCVELYWAYLSLLVIFDVWCLYSPVALVIGMFVYCF